MPDLEGRKKYQQLGRSALYASKSHGTRKRTMKKQYEQVLAALSTV